MCLTHFDLKIFKAALFFLKICHADPHDCVQHFPSSSLPKNPSQKARHAYFCRADRLTFGRYESDPLPDLELQCSKLLESEDPDEELWAVHVPPKAPGAISWNISWDENRWKMDRKWFGMFVFFFFVLIAELFSDPRSFMFPGTKSKPFKTLNPSCSHIRWQTSDDSIHCFAILQGTNLSLFPRYVWRWFSFSQRYVTSWRVSFAHVSMFDFDFFVAGWIRVWSTIWTLEWAKECTSLRLYERVWPFSDNTTCQIELRYMSFFLRFKYETNCVPALRWFRASRHDVCHVDLGILGISFRNRGVPKLPGGSNDQRPPPWRLPWPGHDAS